MLAQKHNQLKAKEAKLGWQLLFDGANPGAWRAFNGQSFPSNWAVEEGALKCLGKAEGDSGGDLVYGGESFSNFELYLEWKISPGGNSGIFYHTQEGPAYKAPYATAPEYQLIDDLNFPQPLEAWQKTAADYAMYDPPANKRLKPAGQWNSARILYTPEKVEYWLNEEITVSFVPQSPDWHKRRNSGKWEAFPDYAKKQSGLIALQDHGSPVWFRNIKIRPIK
jgi:hypothetical protein